MRFIGISNIIALCFLLAASPALAEIEEEFLPHTLTFREISSQIDRLEEGFRDMDPKTCLSTLNTLRGELTQIGDTDPQMRKTLLGRLDMIELAVLFYQGDMTEAETIAGRIFRHDPGAALSGSVGSAEMAQWFESIRENHVGFLTVLSRPGGTIIYLDGVKFGVTPLENAYAPVGEHRIELMKEGYTQWTGQLFIKPGEITPVNADLSRNSGTLYLWVSPPGTTITLDSVPITITTRPLSPDLFPLALFMGFWPESMALPTIIDAVVPGKRMIRFEGNCYKAKQFLLNVSIGKFFVPPVVLERAESFVTVRSTPSGRPIYIDGNRWGTTPAIRRHACPGSHYIEVRFESGKHWGRRVFLTENLEHTYEAYPRPTILFLGCGSENTGLAIEAAHGIESWINTSDAFTLMDRSIADRFRYRPTVASLFEQLSQPGFTPDDPALLNNLGNLTASILETGTTLVAFARIEPPAAEQPGYLFFLGMDALQPDRLPIPAGLPDMQPPGIVSDALNGLPPLSRLRSGMRVTTVADSVLISEIIPGGPSETSPLRSGDRILEMNGITVNSRETFEDILRNPDSPESLGITVARGPQEIQTTIAMQRQPITLPVKDSLIAYNLFLAGIEQALADGEASPARVLNAGICYLALGRPAETLNVLKTVDTWDTSGIGLGTVQYLMHLAAQDMGNPASASEYLAAAEKAETATIIHGDGPWLRDLLQ